LLSITPELIKDINTTEAGSFPHELTKVSETFYFGALRGDTGGELWRSDGTAAGTRLVKDVRPGPASSGILELTAAGNTLFFTADDGVNGIELWRSDGTEAGTYLVKNIGSGGTSSKPRSLVAVGDVLYFAATDDAGRELWRSDGTEKGTYRVADIRMGSASSDPDKLVSHNGAIVFTADDGEHGIEPWISDGSAAGTHLLEDVSRGASSSRWPSSGKFITLGDALYFAADGGQGDTLWFYSSTAGLKSVAWPTPLSMSVFQGSLFFGSADWLLRTDGASSATFLVKDFSLDGPASIRNLTDVGGTLYITVLREDTYSLWRSDGTPEGTIELKRLPTTGVDPGGFTAAGDLLFFGLFNAEREWELWKSDGTSQGTEFVASYAWPTGGEGGGHLAKDGVLFFSGHDGQHGYELWRSDGSAGGTAMVVNLNQGNDGSQNRRPKFSAGELVFFDALDESVGYYELWKTDGTADGTTRVAGGMNGPWLGDDYTILGDRVFFNAGSGNQGQLWTSDGTEAGTHLVKDLGPPNVGSSVRSLLVLGGSIYFVGEDGIHGRQLWKSDGTEVGTLPITEIRKGLQNSIFGGLAESRGLLFFTADDGASGFEPWVSDGTAEGTRRLGDLVPGRESSYPTQFTTFGDRTLFWTSDGRGLYTLWATDGTPDGTTPILTADEASGPSSAQGMVVAGDFLFFTADDAAGGRELWRSDGTPSGTQRVLDINPGPSSGLEYDWNHLIAVGRDLYFVADDGVHGQELWRSDGTPEGTALVRDIGVDGRASYIGPLVNVFGTVFFEADSGIAGRELWRSDGTQAGTAPAGLDPGGNLPITIGRKVVIPGRDASVGEELFSLTPSPGDTNYDGLVDLSDFGRLKASFGAKGASLAADFDLNGVVDLSDFGLLKDNFARAAERQAKLPPQANQAVVEAELSQRSAAEQTSSHEDDGDVGPSAGWLEAVAYQLAWARASDEHDKAE
jgi:ELWxxDGT repeat protein